MTAARLRDIRRSHADWTARTAAAHARFLAAARDAEGAQAAILARIVRDNADTEFGRLRGFARIRSPDDFRRAVPVHSHDDLRPWIDRVARGERRVLTAEHPQVLAPTGGTTAGTKRIPFTASLRREFAGAVRAWLHAQYLRRPAIARGRMYWSLTPPVTRPRPAGDALPTRFPDDDAYLGPGGRAWWSAVSAVPPDVARERDAESFRDATCLHLLAARDLSAISVWSPTFLLVLLDHIVRHRDRLLDGLTRAGGRPGRRRAAELRDILDDAARTGRWSAVWPHMAILSAWAHGDSERPALALARRFPGVEFEPKGLLATEACVSVPVAPDLDPILAAGAHFFEFAEEPGTAMRLAHELETGRRYRVVVTTGGGLYRYDLGDLVRVTGRLGTAPALRFEGRAEDVSDRVGEKLHAGHVRAAVDAALAGRVRGVAFALVAPVAGSGRAALRYALFIDAREATDALLRAAGAAVERALRDNFHYDHARRMRQLHPLRVFRVDRDAAAPEDVVMATLRARGRREGDIKPPMLDHADGWERRFRGRWA